MSPLGVLALVAACLFWGTTGAAASFLPENVSPLATGAATMGIGGVLLFAATARSALRVLRDPLGRRWVLIGAIGVFIYPLAFYTGMDLAGVAVGNVVALGSGPVFTALLERIVERRPLSTRWAVATVLAILGITLLALGKAPGLGESAAGAAAEDANRLPGVLVALLAGFAYALYAYSSSRAIQAGGHGSSATMGAMFGIGALGLLVVLAVLGAPLLQAPWTVGIAAYLAIGPTFLGYLLFGYGLRTVRSTTATTITLLEPVFSTVAAVVVVGERLTLLGWVGIGLILVGLTVLFTARRPRSGVAPSLDSSS